MRTAEPHLQTPAEEKWNAITHGLGVLFSIAALAVLVTTAVRRGAPLHVVTVSVYGASLLVLYAVSTCYHACPDGPRKNRLQVLDHIAIYLLIAGTYTPFLLVLIGGAWGWSLFGVIWGLAAVGTVFKLLFGDRFLLISTGCYIAMGWLVLVGLRPFMQHLPGGAIAWLLAGGLAYTGGVVFFLWDSLPYNHAVWHLFVLTGSVCHFCAVMFYVVPATIG